MPPHSYCYHQSQEKGRKKLHTTRHGHGAHLAHGMGSSTQCLDTREGLSAAHLASEVSRSEGELLEISWECFLWRGLKRPQSIKQFVKSFA